jgi:hypothetical protein
MDDQQILENYYRLLEVKTKKEKIKFPYIISEDQVVRTLQQIELVYQNLESVPPVKGGTENKITVFCGCDIFS